MPLEMRWRDRNLILSEHNGKIKIQNSNLVKNRLIGSALAWFAGLRDAVRRSVYTKGDTIEELVKQLASLIRSLVKQIEANEQLKKKKGHSS